MYSAVAGAMDEPVGAYARNIDNLGVLASRVEQHGPATYRSEPITRFYEEHAAAPGGWTDWRDFTVENTQPESDIIRSFRLRPVDGGPVMRHRPGQYLTFTLDLPEHGRLKRNYSISSGPEDTSYRITVKREAEPGVPRGIVSNWLHDHADTGATLKVAPPAGEFYLDEESQRPVVLLSGGVGLTPLVSMLEAIVQSGANITGLRRQSDWLLFRRRQGLRSASIRHGF